MERTVSATEARIRFGEFMRLAQHGPVIVEKNGVAQVVILSKRAYDTLIEHKPKQDWRELLQALHQRVRDELAGRELPPPEEILSQIREERDEQIDHLR